MDEKKIIVTLTEEQILMIPGALEFLYKISESKPIVDFILGRAEPEEKKDNENIIPFDPSCDSI